MEEGWKEEEDELLLPHQAAEESFAVSLQQELLNVSPDLLAPCAAELDMLKREKQQQAREMKTLQLKKEAMREEKERVERLAT